MKCARFVRLVLCLTTTFLLAQSNPVSLSDQTAGVASPIGATQADPEAQARILNSYGKLPLRFEANQGQTDARVKFLSRTGGYSLFLTRDEAVLAWSGKKITKPSPQRLKPTSLASFRGTATVMPFPKTDAEKTSTQTAPAADRPNGGVLRMKLRNANPAAKVTGVDELTGTSNYFIGNDPAKWRTNVPSYAKVKYEGIYPGIDMVYYGNQRQLEYDFIVAPGADPHRISFDVRGARRMHRDADGDLVLTMKMGEDEIRWHKPVVYQEKDGARQEIAARYAITDKDRVGFELAKYDASQPLYIDPLIYSTYLGGSSYDQGNGIAVDSSGNAYVTGQTYSKDFPTTPGAFQTTHSGYAYNAFVAKFNPAGSALVYSTYLGGSGANAGGGGDSAAGIVVDASGNAYVTGTTWSADFPTTPGAFQTTLSGGVDNAFVTKLNPTGSALAYSSYLGGSSSNQGNALAVDSAGDAYVTGFTSSTDFPITPGAFQTTNGRGGKGFVTKFNPTGSALVYSTFLGGTGQDYFGGDHGSGIAVDSSGNAYVTGQTLSQDFPITPGVFQSVCGDGCQNAFVTKLDPTGSVLVYSTYLGGSGFYGDLSSGIAVDSSGNAYVTGATQSMDFPTTSDAFQATCGGGGWGGCSDAFVTKINPSGSALVYSTYLGGHAEDSGIGITVDSSGHAYVIGYTDGNDFPTKYPLQAYSYLQDAFVTKLNPEGSALAYSTYLGPAGNVVYSPPPPSAGAGIAVNSLGNAYVTGWTSSPNFSTMNPLQPFLAGGYDAFVAKISAEPSGITLFPLHLDFGSQPMGVASNPRVSVLNNTGSTSLTITSISISGANSGDFAQTNNCGASLQPGASCSITVTFTPTAIGNRSAVVKIVDSAPRQWVSLTGLGLLDSLTILTSNVNPSALGKPVTLTAKVSSPSGGIPTGFVYFRNGATTTLADKALIAGKATFTTNQLPLGLNVLTVIYQGDANYGFSTSAPVNQEVREAASVTTLTSSPNPSSYGQSVTFTATVSSSLGAPPDGEAINFMEGTTVLGTGVLSAGFTSFTTSALVTGTKSIRAFYAGDANLVGSTSKVVNQVVTKATTATTLVSSLNPSTVGQSVTFTATMTPQLSGTVKGYVTFYDGTTTLKSVYTTGGVAKYTTSTLTSGSHTITATYNGNANFTGSSASLTQKVN